MIPDLVSMLVHWWHQDWGLMGIAESRRLWNASLNIKRSLSIRLGYDSLLRYYHNKQLRKVKVGLTLFPSFLDQRVQFPRRPRGSHRSRNSNNENFQFFLPSVTLERKKRVGSTVTCWTQTELQTVKISGRSPEQQNDMACFIWSSHPWDPQRVPCSSLLLPLSPKSSIRLHS